MKHYHKKLTLEGFYSIGNFQYQQNHQQNIHT